MTDPAVLAGDGSMVDYCALPELDGSGLMATDISKGNTPGCAYEHFPRFSRTVQSRWSMEPKIFAGSGKRLAAKSGMLSALSNAARAL